MNATGNKIKHLREEANMTLKQLSDNTGVGQSTISDIETGKAKNPKMATLKKIADYFNVSVDELMKSESVTKEKLNKYEVVIKEERETYECANNILNEKGFLFEDLLLEPFENLFNNPIVQKYFEYDYDKLESKHMNEMFNFLISTIAFKINELKKYRNFTSSDYKNIQIYIDDDNEIKCKKSEDIEFNTPTTTTGTAKREDSTTQTTTGKGVKSVSAVLDKYRNM